MLDRLARIQDRMESSSRTSLAEDHEDIVYLLNRLERSMEHARASDAASARLARELAIRSPNHLFGGNCPSEFDWDLRDPQCPVCVGLIVSDLFHKSVVHRRRTLGECCKRCHRDSVVGFSVSDVVWTQVVRDRWNTLCVMCFDEEAHEAGVPYVFGAVWPCPWNEWEEPEEPEG